MAPRSGEERKRSKQVSAVWCCSAAGGMHWISFLYSWTEKTHEAVGNHCCKKCVKCFTYLYVEVNWEIWVEPMCLAYPRQHHYLKASSAKEGNINMSGYKHPCKLSRKKKIQTRHFVTASVDNFMGSACMCGQAQRRWYNWLTLLREKQQTKWKHSNSRVRFIHSAQIHRKAMCPDCALPPNSEAYMAQTLAKESQWGLK